MRSLIRWTVCLGLASVLVLALPLFPLAVTVPSVSQAAEKAEPLDLNTATADQLKTLPDGPFPAAVRVEKASREAHRRPGGPSRLASLLLGERMFTHKGAEALVRGTLKDIEVGCRGGEQAHRGGGKPKTPPRPPPCRRSSLDAPPLRFFVPSPPHGSSQPLVVVGVRPM